MTGGFWDDNGGVSGGTWRNMEEHGVECSTGTAGINVTHYVENADLQQKRRVLQGL